MTSQKARTEFVLLMAKEYPELALGQLQELCRQLCRNGTTYKRLQEEFCSVEMSERQARRHDVAETRCEARILDICSEFELNGADDRPKPIFQGDPRGYTVKLQVPSGRSTDWGNEGIGVPTS